MADLTMDTLVSLCKRRGFIFPSSEIYGGLASAWDYGPMGVELKKRIQEFWWRGMTQLNDNIVGLDAAIMMHPRVWEASGHVENFTDPLIDCRQCKHRFRADQIPEENLKAKKCPDCGANALTDARKFNLMFTTHMGPVEAEGGLIYLRPETAQGIYVNYKNVLQTGRVKVPFGIAQVGKAFRNEITTKNYIFRTCEFEQMEMQYFVHPSEDMKWFEHWKEKRFQYYLDLGVRKAKLRFHQHGPDELAFYAKVAFDIEYEFPFGWKELEGIHDRTDYDLKRHTEFSGKDLSYLDEVTKERYIPYIIETSAGLTRTVLVVICRRLPRGGGGGREARGAALPPPDRPDHGRRLPPGEEGRARGARPQARGGAARGVPHVLRRGRGHRTALPPAGRGRHALLRHRGLPVQGGPDRHRALPRQHAAGEGEDGRRRRHAAEGHQGLPPGGRVRVRG